MVKVYFRYSLSTIASAVAGTASNIQYDEEGNLVYSACCQYVLVTRYKSGEVLAKLYEAERTQQEITALRLSPDRRLLAVGHKDGEIVLWDLGEMKVRAIFNQHRAAVSVLKFDRQSSLLASGSADTSLILWDIISEQSLFQQTMLLNAHRNAITDLDFFDTQSNDGQQQLISVAKDGLIIVWDLKLASVSQTLSSNNTEAWSVCVLPALHLALVGTNTDEVVAVQLGGGNTIVGSFKKNSFARALQLLYVHSHSLLLVLTTERTVEVFRILTQGEVARKRKRKAKRLAEKQSKKKEDGQTESQIQEQKAVIAPSEDDTPQISEYFAYNTTFHFQQRVRAIEVCSQTQSRTQDTATTNLLQLIAATYGNTVSVHSVALNAQTSYFEHAHLRSIGGNTAHSETIRAVEVSDNDQLYVSGSKSSLRVWDSESAQCTHSFACERQVTALVFLPKSRYFVAGDKEGYLSLYDLSSAELASDLKAHEASIWSLALHAQAKSFSGITLASASADKRVRFWQLVADKKSKRLALAEARTVWFPEDIHCVRFTPNGEHYLVSLLDYSVRVHFCDSDREFLSLYGHKLPVLSFDVSSDNAIVVSGSADKNIKIWGLDFGNCHKSIYAHQDSVTQIKLVQETHYFFSCSKDGSVKYWDGDTFQLILHFEESQSELWALSVSSIGDYFVVAGNERVLRVYRQTREQVFVSEEEEKRQEKILIEDYANERLQQEQRQTGTADQKDEKQKKPDSTRPEKKKFMNLKYGEEMMAAIDAAESLREEQTAHELQLRDGQQQNGAPRTYEKIYNQTIPEFVLNEIAKTRATELEDSLKFVHIAYIEKILHYIHYYVVNGLNIELATRILVFILHHHEKAILNSSKMAQLLIAIQKHVKAQLQGQRDILGFNLEAIKLVKRDLRERQGARTLLEDPVFQNRENLF